MGFEITPCIIAEVRCADCGAGFHVLSGSILRGDLLRCGACCERCQFRGNPRVNHRYCAARAEDHLHDLERERLSRERIALTAAANR